MRDNLQPVRAALGEASTQLVGFLYHGAFTTQQLSGIDVPPFTNVRAFPFLSLSPIFLLCFPVVRWCALFWPAAVLRKPRPEAWGAAKVQSLTSIEAFRPRARALRNSQRPC